MATYQIQGGPWNASLIASLLITCSTGDSYNLLPFLNGDIAIVPAKQAKVRVTSRENPIATIPGQVTDGSIGISLAACPLVDTTGAGWAALYEALAQSGSGTAFAPYTSFTTSTFDGDTAESYLCDTRAKCFLITIVMKAQGTALGQRLDIYAEIETPDPNIANAGGSNSLQIQGALPRRGCITLATA